MTDIKRTVQDDKGVRRGGDGPAEPAQGRPGTAGTDRDYDASEEAANLGHGHAARQRQRSDESGRSFTEVTEADREGRDLGGPGG